MRLLPTLLMVALLLLIACQAGPGVEDAPQPPPEEEPTPTPVLDSDGDGAIDSEDCAPDDATTYPGAEELCDGLDNDCDGTIPATELDTDADGDGFTACAGDCAPDDPAVYPGAAEACDGLDTNCDGARWASELDEDGDGFFACGEDCAEGDATVHPDATDVCNRLDDDCDGLVDEDANWDYNTAEPIEGVLTRQDAWASFSGGPDPEVSGNVVPREVVSPGDVNGDGYDDLLFAGYFGPAYLFYGPFCEGEYATAQADAVLWSNRTWFYRRLFEVGDLNGDGFDDVQVHDHIWFGPVEGEVWWDTADAWFESGHNMGPPEWLASGDWNGDGQGDLAIGSYQAGGWPPTDETSENGTPIDHNTGQVAVMEGPFLGGPIDADDAVAWLIGEDIWNTAGRAVENAGDVNGDGLDDLVVGAPGLEHPEQGLPTGAVYVMLAPFEGEQPLAEARARWIGDDFSPVAAFGERLRGVGDVTGDGVPDLLAGATTVPPYLLDGGFTGEGRIGEDVQPLFTDNPAHVLLGGGDLDGDGIPDFAAGAGGVTAIVLGTQPAQASAAIWEPRLDAYQVDTPFYFRVDGGAFVGDTNADGRTEFAVAGSVSGKPGQVVLLFLGR